jgi:hypothetical protein
VRKLIVLLLVILTFVSLAAPSFAYTTNVTKKGCRHGGWKLYVIPNTNTPMFTSKKECIAYAKS